MHRRRLSRSRLRGTFLHNWLGDRILHKSLWLPSRESLARGWLVAFPITVIPFLPVQSVFACLAALFVRGNVFLCIGLQFLSTPLTAPVQLPACYFVGEVVLGANPRQVWQEVRTTPSHLLTGRAMKSLYLGAAVIGVIGGAAGYAILHGTWQDRPRRSSRTANGPVNTVLPKDAPPSAPAFSDRRRPKSAPTVI